MGGKIFISHLISFHPPRPIPVERGEGKRGVELSRSKSVLWIGRGLESQIRQQIRYSVLFISLLLFTYMHACVF